jgi:hypothetical protein
MHALVQPLQEQPMIKKLLMLALTSGLAAKALKVWIDREATRDHREPARADVQRWEDEGGNPAPTAARKAARKAAPSSAKAAAAADVEEPTRAAPQRARRAAGGASRTPRSPRAAGA